MEMELNSNLYFCTISMHSPFFTSIRVNSSRLAVSQPSRLHSRLLNSEICFPRLLLNTLGCIFFINLTWYQNTKKFTVYHQVRPNAVALVDSFNYTDHYLGSVLGRYDGNVYPKLYEAAWKDPLNDSVVPDGYVEYIKPLLQNNLHLSRL